VAANQGGVNVNRGFLFGIVLSFALPGAAAADAQAGGMVQASGAGMRGSDIVCGTGDIDSFEVLDFNSNPVPYFVLALATGPLFSGPAAPVVDPTIEIINLNTGALVAFNDDNGFGSNTFSVTGLELVGGFLTIQHRDSFVFFNANFPFRVVVRGFGGSCGSYALFIL